MTSLNLLAVSSSPGGWWALLLLGGTAGLCRSLSPSGSMRPFLWSSSPASVVARGYSFPDTGLYISPC